MIHPEENLGAAFSPSSYLQTRQETIRLARDLAHRLQPGMSEDEAHLLFKELLAQNNISKVWHPTKIRFGKNTLCQFRDLSDPSIRLGDGDLFYVDIGPVIEGHEGDYGESFRCGGGGDPLITASTQVFAETSRAWREQKLTGPALYRFAAESAKRHGFVLNGQMDGHRLGDFPHALHHKGDLAAYPHVPTAGLWVLEIHLWDRARERGAFFEDVLGWEDLKV